MLHRTGSHPMHVELNTILKICWVILIVVTLKSQNFAEKRQVLPVKTQKTSQNNPTAVTAK